MGKKQRAIRLQAEIYQQFDADISLDVPGEAYGGWKTIPVELPLERTALVSMHTWSFDPPEKIMGLFHAVEYLGRADRIMGTAYPRLLSAVRKARMPLFHVVGGKSYFRDFPGYKRTVKLAGPAPQASPGAPRDPAVAALNKLRIKHGFPGEHNLKDIDVAHNAVSFPPEARPLDTEPIAENAHQLNAICREHGVSHLVYVGFAINWCILMSPGGMMEMSRLGYLCSTIRECTTAVENKETARRELCKQLALWRVSLAFGLVFGLDNFVAALQKLSDKRGAKGKRGRSPKSRSSSR